MLKSITQFAIFVFLLLSIILLSAKFLNNIAFAQFVNDCAGPSEDYFPRAPLQARDPCTGVVEDAFDPDLVPALAVDCDPYTTGAACCTQLANTYSAQQGIPITATCTPYCKMLSGALDFTCPYYPPPDNGCGSPNYPNACSQGVEPDGLVAVFCCNYITPTPTPTPTPGCTPLGGSCSGATCCSPNVCIGFVCTAPTPTPTPVPN